MLRHSKILLVVMAILSTGCTPVVDIRGNMADPEILKILQVGVHNKDHIAELLGPPSSTAPFNPNVWLYIGRRTETVSFFDPTVLEERITVFKFNKNDILEGMHDVNTKDGLIITPLDRTTVTSGHDISFLNELFGSFGQFHRPGASR